MNWPVILFFVIAMAGSFLVGTGLGWTAGRGQRRGTIVIAAMGTIFALVCGSILLGMTTPGEFVIINTIR